MCDNVEICATPWLRRLVADLSPRRTVSVPRSVHVRFVVQEVALGQVSPSTSVFPSASLHQCSTLIFIYTLLLSDGQRAKPLHLPKSNSLLEIGEHWIPEHRHFLLHSAFKVLRSGTDMHTTGPMFNGDHKMKMCSTFSRMQLLSRCAALSTFTPATATRRPDGAGAAASTGPFIATYGRISRRNTEHVPTLHDGPFCRPCARKGAAAGKTFESGHFRKCWEGCGCFCAVAGWYQWHSRAHQMQQHVSNTDTHNGDKKKQLTLGKTKQHEQY
jgi:hypothetical protein